MRLDTALAQRGLCSSRERGKTAVLQGLVAVNGREERKPSRAVTETDALTLRQDASLQYVGRGALKLLRALDIYGIAPAGLRCLDIGASTGGFTQVLLERGAAQVIAVDVGHDQLAQALREDPRVLCLEGKDVRTLRLDPVEFICADVSFISLRLILPHIFTLLQEDAAAVCLIKPQFELGPGLVGKRGVVKNPKLQARAIRQVCEAARAEGFALCGLSPSPIAGGEGNLEFLLYLRKGGCDAPLPALDELVREAAKNCA